MTEIFIIKDILRMKQWIKNLLIFIPALFAQVELKPIVIFELLGSFLCFSFLASSVYLINDIKDIKEDQTHEFKKQRAIASGRISIHKATTISIILCVLSFVGFFIIDPIGFIFAAFYFILNLSYSFGLKKIPFLELIILISGYLIRLQIGAITVSVPLSIWIIITISLVALYLILMKRYSDIQLNKSDLRTSTYRKIKLRSVISFLVPIIFCIYSLYIILEFFPTHKNQLIWTTLPIVLFAFIYFHRTLLASPHQDSLNLLFRKPWFLSLCIIWTGIIILVLYS